MSSGAALAIAIVGALLLVAAFGKPAKHLVGGIFSRDRKGRITLVLTPTRKAKRRKRGRR